MKYLLVLVVVGIGLWMVVSRLRGGADRERPASKTANPPLMVQCAHCGLHLASADALPEGSRLYCSDAHRRLGPAGPPQP